MKASRLMQIQAEQQAKEARQQSMQLLVTKYHPPVINTFRENYGSHEAFEQMVLSVPERLEAIVMLTAEGFRKMFKDTKFVCGKCTFGVGDLPVESQIVLVSARPSEVSLQMKSIEADSNIFVVDQRSPGMKHPKKEVFCNLYAVVPDCADKVRREIEDKKKKENARILGKGAENLQRYGADPEAVKNFALNSLPGEELPERRFYDGSYKRVLKLAQKKEARKFGDETNPEGVFAVIYPYSGSQVITVYVPGLDFVKMYADTMRQQLATFCGATVLSEEQAERISGNLAHDSFYKIHETVYRGATGFDTFIHTIANISGANEGDTIKTVLPPENVTIGCANGRLYADFDDEEVGVFLGKGNRLTFYIP